MSETNETTKFYTLEEVRKQNGANDSRVWIIYKDIVYDVTDYLEEHPGGGDLITEYAGLDATKAFDDFGHSSDAKKQLKQLKIGEIVEEERKKLKTKTTAKVVTDSGVEKPKTRSCISIVTCGLCG